MKQDPSQMPPVMILCGGRGTRLREVTELLPKPMVPIGGLPIIWHIMKSYAAFGVRRFILCLGYKREEFVDFFLNYRARTSDITLTLGNEPQLTFHRDDDEADWQVTLAGTGEDTMTGHRVLKAARYLLPEDENFFLTYGDGVADINIRELYKSHLDAGKLLTISAVHPEGRFGELELDGDTVLSFAEKPLRRAGFINGGYMVANRRVVSDYLADKPDCFFEASPMANIAADGEMRIFRHEGFWQCMDNPREYKMLNDLWASGEPPWARYWKKS